MTSFLKQVSGSIKHWYVPLLIGILLIITGIWTFAAPMESYLALSIVFSVTFLVVGIMECFFAIANRKEISNWGWTLVLGILTTVVGFLLIARPEVSMATLPIFIGLVILFRSIAGIGWSIDMRDSGLDDWKSFLGLGILGIIASMIILWNPMLGGLTITIWTGLAFLVTGIWSIYLAFQLRKVHKKIKDITPKPAKD